MWAPLVAHNEKEVAPDKENGRVACPKDKLSFKFFFFYEAHSEFFALQNKDLKKDHQAHWWAV